MLFRLVLAVASALSSALIVAVRSPGSLARCRHQPGLRRWRQRRRHAQERLHRAATTAARRRRPEHLDGPIRVSDRQHVAAHDPVGRRSQPGKYYLVQQAAGAAAPPTCPYPTPPGSIPMSATSGKVALVTNGTALACGPMMPGVCPTLRSATSSVTARRHSDSEGGAPTGNLGNTTAALRGAGGDRH